MKNIFGIAAALCFIFSSCGSDSDIADKSNKKDTAAVVNDFENITKEGVIGIYGMPEMLTLSLMDSASTEDIGSVMGKDYSLLETEAAAIGAQVGGPPGVINYNNDPKNFKFECLLPVKKMPAQKPAHCQITVLEADVMLIYNHHGPYEKLPDAYDNIREYLVLHGLAQSGPMREFYPSGMSAGKDPSKWLTRIMVPVLQPQ